MGPANNKKGGAKEVNVDARLKTAGGVLHPSYSALCAILECTYTSARISNLVSSRTSVEIIGFVNLVFSRTAVEIISLADILAPI